MASSTYNARIELALANLNYQEKPNIIDITKKYSLIKLTLRRQFKDKTLSRATTILEYY